MFEFAGILHAGVKNIESNENASKYFSTVVLALSINACNIKHTSVKNNNNNSS